MVRIANKDDIDRIVEMEIFVNRYNLKNILPNDFLYDKNTFEKKRKWVEETFVEMGKNENLEIYVLEDDKIVKGYFSVEYDQNKMNECVLLQFLIDVPFQNDKYGTLLLSNCLDIVREKGKRVIRIEDVFEQNITAIKFYEKFGFEIVSKYLLEDWNLYVYKFIKNIE